jgi:hypothetical protein
MAFGGEQFLCIKDEEGNIVYKTFNELSNYRFDFKIFNGENFISVKIKQMAKHKLLKLTTTRDENIICTENQILGEVIKENKNNLIFQQEAKYLKQNSMLNIWINSGWYDKYIVNEGNMSWFESSLKRKIEFEKVSYEINAIPIKNVQEIEPDLTYIIEISKKLKQKFILPTLSILECKDECFNKEKANLKTKKEKFYNRCVRGVEINLC